MKIGITNLKGGVGKSTITQNLAACLAQNENSVQIIDTDINQNSIDWAAAREDDLPEIIAVGCSNPKMVSKAANSAINNFDYVLIDGSPQIGELTTRIMLTTDILLIPIQTSSQDIRSFGQFAERLDAVREIKEANNETLNAYIILNMYQGYKVQKELVKVIESFNVPIFKSSIRERISYVESAIEGRGVVEWNDTKAAEEFIEVAKEFFERAEELGLIQ